MKARVQVGFKPGVLDPEAMAINRSLKGLGFDEVEGVRRVKVIELDLATTDGERAKERVRAMCDELLANPVIESYAVELLE